MKYFNKRLLKDLALLTAGSLIYIIGFKLFSAQHHFVPSGTVGLGILLNNIWGNISVSSYYLLLNIPLFIIAARGVSVRFLLLNLYSMALMSIALNFFNYSIPVDNVVFAAIASGALMGLGFGFIFSSAGGSGGPDVLAVILNIRKGISIPTFNFVANSAVMLFAATQVTTDQLIASILMVAVTSFMTDYVLVKISQRKEVQIICRDSEAMKKALLESKFSGTVFHGRGLYSNNEYVMIVLIIYSSQQRPLERLVNSVDPDAIIIVEKTFEVIGKHISPRKEY